jgi:hypothetical protein
MSDRPVCKPTDHLFVPVIEVTVPLLRCIHCNVFAYQDTVKQLAKSRSYTPDADPRPARPVSFWRRWWHNLRRNLGLR